MAQDTIDKIINIRFNYGELVEGWKKTAQAVDDNKEALRVLKDEYKGGTLNARDYNQALLENKNTQQALRNELRQYTKEIQNNIKIETQASGSINQLRANISKLTAEYNALSGAEREGAIGKRVAANIKSQQEAITEAEKSLGNYRSQVGSYEEALRAVLPAEASQLVTLGKTIEKSGGVAKAFGLMTGAIGRMAKAAWAFISTPLGAILTALTITIALVVKNWDKLTDSLGITSPARDAARAIEELNKQLDYLGNNAEKSSTEALKKYTEALRNAKGDTEALAQAQKSYNIELQNTEYNRAKEALQAAYKAEETAFKAYQRASKKASGLFGSKEVEMEALKAFNEAKKIRERAQADLAKADNDRTKTQAEELAKQVENDKKAAEEARKIRINSAEQAAEDAKKARIAGAEEAHKKLVAIWDQEQADEVARIAGMEMAINQKQAEYRNRLLKAQTQGGDAGAQDEMLRIAQEQVNILRDQLQDVDTFRAAYEAMGLSGIEIDNKRLEALKALQDAQNALRNAQNKAAEDEVKAQERSTQISIQGAQQLAGALGGLAEAAGADAGVVAMLAIAQSAAAMGAALHKAFSRSATVWDGIAGAVAAIATITTIISQIKSLNSSAEGEKSKYRYAQGGLVTGPGTGTSDSIPARLSNGEAVMTARAVNDWGAMLSAMNVASGGNAIQVSNLPQRNDGMRGMERMMERALMNIPAPVVSVVDINKGQTRVKVQNNLGKLGRKKYA